MTNCDSCKNDLGDKIPISIISLKKKRLNFCDINCYTKGLKKIGEYDIIRREAIKEYGRFDTK